MIRLLVPLLLSSLALAETSPALRQTVTPDKAKLGEPFVRELVVTHPKSDRYELKLPSDPGEFEYLDVQRQRQDGPDTATTTFRVKMSGFELGKRTLPGLDFEVATPSGENRFTAPETGVEIVPTLPPDADQQGAQLQDIRPPETVTVPSYALVWGALGCVAAVALAFVAFRLWKRRSNRAPPAPILPLDVRTRQALSELDSEKLPEQGRTKEFYSRLSDIVRGYLHERYRVDALECTTRELLDNLGRVATPGLPVEALAAFLQEADLVKFAKAQMSAESCHHALQFGHRLLDLTHVSERQLP